MPEWSKASWFKAACLPDLVNLLHPLALITFNNERVTFQDLFVKLTNYGTRRTGREVSFVAQPIGSNGLLICVHGELLMTFIRKLYLVTIVLRRFGLSDGFVIKNLVLTVL